MVAPVLAVCQEGMKLLSIVVPAYNEEAFLGPLLHRIASIDTASAGFQKEVIVVDDGSRDRTPEIARSFAAQGVRCFTQTNQGKGRAVQRGWPRCQNPSAATSGRSADS